MQRPAATEKLVDIVDLIQTDSLTGLPKRFTMSIYSKDSGTV